MGSRGGGRRRLSRGGGGGGRGGGGGAAQVSGRGPQKKTRSTDEIKSAIGISQTSFRIAVCNGRVCLSASVLLAAQQSAAKNAPKLLAAATGKPGLIPRSRRPMRSSTPPRSSTCRAPADLWPRRPRHRTQRRTRAGPEARRRFRGRSPGEEERLRGAEERQPRISPRRQRGLAVPRAAREAGRQMVLRQPKPAGRKSSTAASAPMSWTQFEICHGYVEAQHEYAFQRARVTT